MEWTQYPTEQDHRNKTNGRKRQGQSWGPAPGPRRQWALPADGERNAQAFVSVVVMDDPERSYALDSDQVGEAAGTVAKAVAGGSA